MMKRTQILFLVLLTISFSVIAQKQDNEILELNIKQAQEYAIENNKSLKNTKTDVKIAKQQLWQTISQGLPQVSGTLDYTNYFNYKMTLGIGGSSSTPNIDYTKLDAGDMEILTMLGSILGGGATEIKMKDNANAKLQISQLIFSGQYIAGIQLAKISQMLVDMSIEKSELDIKESITNSYYVSLITLKSMEIIDKNIENLSQTLKQTNALLSAGMVEETDADQIKMSINMLENAKRSLQRNAELNNNLMKFQLGIDYDTKLVLTEKYDDLLADVNLSGVLRSEFLPEENINVKLTNKQEELSQKMLNMQRWSYAPTLFGAYNHTEKLLKSDFDMNPKNLFTLNLSVPIFSSGQRKASVEQKKLELLKVQNTKEIIIDQLMLQEKQLRYNLTSAFEQYQSQLENLELAKKIYRNTDLKFRQGVVSSFDLIQANNNLIQAENSVISASMEVLQAKLEFDKLINSI